MKIHTDKLTERDLFGILAQVKSEGLVADHVILDVTRSGSRSREAAYNVALSSAVKEEGDGRRPSGTSWASGRYGATYDEWGHFLALLFQDDELALANRYLGALDYHEKTTGNYARGDFEERWPWVSIEAKTGRTPARLTDREYDRLPFGHNRWTYAPRV